MPDSDMMTPSSEWILRRLRRARRGQAAGGLLLFASFFMPMVKGCSSPIVPAKDIASMIKRTVEDPWPIHEKLFEFSAMLMYTSPYLLGALTMLTVLRRRKPSLLPDNRVGVPVAVLAGSVASFLIVAVTIEMISSWPPSGMPLVIIILLVVLGFSCIYLLKSLRMGATGLLSLRWYVAFPCTLWFGIFAIQPSDTYFGLWVSLIGSLTIGVFCFQEARILGRLSVWQTLRDLLACKLVLYDPSEPRCVQCNYLLFGLTVPRCPECGLGFGWDEYGLKPAGDLAATAPL